MNHSLSLTLAAVACGLFASCSSDEPSSKVTDFSSRSIELTAADAEVAQAQFEFSFKFLAGVAQVKIDNDEIENFAISPVSADMTLSMLANTVSENKSAPIVKLLGFDGLSAINSYNAKLLQYLPVYNDITKLTLINNIWYSERLPKPAAQYVQDMATVYGAELQPIDYSKSSSLDIINGWAKAKTNGLIPTILDDLDPRTKMTLANALYFKSEWESKFDKAKTRREQFNTANGPVQADMMTASNITALYRDVNGTQLLRLPFKGDAYMDIILPPKDMDLRLFCSQFTSDDYAALTGDNPDYKCPVSVQLPRFKTDSQMFLDDYLHNNGVDLDNLDITPTGMFDGELTYAIVSHLASVEINEEGAEAAAATVTALYTAALPKSFKANRPFVYLIVDKKTGAILIAGLMEDPTAEA